MQEGGGGEPRQQTRVLDRIPAPEAAPAQFLVGPDHAEREAQRQEEPREHRPAAHGAEPRVVQVTGDQRGHPERERNGEADEAEVHGRRVDRHVEVLQQRIEPAAIGRRLRQEGVERVVVDDHQEEEEHLHRADERHDVRNQFAMPFPVHLHRHRAEQRQQEHPEHHRTVEPAPVGGDLVEDRLDAVGVALHVADGEIPRHERIDDDAGGHRHQRGDGVERADAAFNQPIVMAPRAGHGGGRRIGRGDKGEEQEERAQGRHRGATSKNRSHEGRSERRTAKGRRRKAESHPPSHAT